MAVNLNGRTKNNFPNDYVADSEHVILRYLSWFPKPLHMLAGVHNFLTERKVIIIETNELQY